MNSYDRRELASIRAAAVFASTQCSQAMNASDDRGAALRMVHVCNNLQEALRKARNAERRLKARTP